MKTLTYLKTKNKFQKKMSSKHSPFIKLWTFRELENSLSYDNNEMLKTIIIFPLEKLSILSQSATK